LESAEEFCRAYQKKHGQALYNPSASNDDAMEQLDENETPSIAINSEQAQYMLSDGTTEIVQKPTYPATPSLPLLTSSCPALVCLVEKSSHGAVRHLSRTKSPMSMAGAWLSQQVSSTISQHQQPQQQQPNGGSTKKIFHLAFMPCHDKKLEASRKDFARNQEQDVDLVLTTQEWFQMMVEYCQTKLTHKMALPQETTWSKEEAVQHVRAHLEGLSLASVRSGKDALQPGSNVNGQVTLLTTRRSTSCDIDTMDVEMDDQDNTNGELSGDNNMDGESIGKTPNNSSFFTIGSGGLADFVFRYAAWRLFDTHVTDVFWKPVVAATASNASQNGAVSARVQRRAAANNRDYHAATLYQYSDASNGNYYYSCDEGPGGVPVLRFAIAYGLQTVQRVLEPFHSNSSKNAMGNTTTSMDYPFDFVEAMACPSGCLNGGGQLRVADRETPSQTRERVALTRGLFSAPLSPTIDMTAWTLAINQEALDAAVPKAERQTRFHVVPPLQHSMGAAAGVAVKDTQW